MNMKGWTLAILLFLGTGLLWADETVGETAETAGEPADGEVSEVADEEVIEEVIEEVPEEAAEEPVGEEVEETEPVVVLEEAVEGAVFVIPVQGMVTDSMFVFMRRSIKEAERTNAQAIILDMDTPGGHLGASIEMLKALMQTPLPTYTYINPNAGSAGAIIALATDYIYMAPVSAVGAAAPVAGGGDLPETMEAKTVSYYSGYIRSAAEANGHRTDIAEAFINIKKEVVIEEDLIVAEGDLLTLSAQEAVRVYEDGPVLAVGIAESIEDLMEQAGLDGPVFEVQPSGFELLAHWITIITPLLMMAVIIGLYFEFQSPGFGLPGIIAVVALLIVFSGHFLAGLTGYEVVVVLILGALLVLVEVLIFPGLILPGVIGAILMVGALIWMMMDRYPSQPILPEPEMLVWPAVNLAIAIMGSVIVISLLIRFLPSVPFLRFLFLEKALASGPALTQEESGLTGEEPVRPGASGVTRSPLYPVGKAFIGGRLVDVVARGEFLERDTPVEVVAMEGSRVVVQRKRA